MIKVFLHYEGIAGEWWESPCMVCKAWGMYSLVLDEKFEDSCHVESKCSLWNQEPGKPLPSPPPPPAPEGCGAAEILALIVLAVVDCIKVGNCKAREVAYTLLSSLVWIPSLAF